ncbi:hypothetical protein LZC95_26505 [Pendulispora brunnea]|uniref:Glycosyltransferase RgtA/B/C/D-like domain-containing protein n=1 Tax=Pendulispora brunnea TaxID=2905690 RepID=A0ABZ2JUN7_9BACT
MGRWLLVLACALCTHFAALGAGFLWLDHAHIEDGLAIFPPSHWHEAFTQGFAGTGYYRPLMALSLSLDALAGTPFVYHATSLAWHAAAAAMVMAAADALGLSRRAATFAGVLFAVHPLADLPANAIAFRSEAMVVVALLALLVFHLRDRPLAAAAALLAGALTKEVAFVLAPLFLVALTHPARPPRRRLWLAEGAALITAMALRLAFAPSWRASHEALSASEAIGTRLASLAKGAGAVLFPVDRHVCDAFPITAAWHPMALLGLALVIALARFAVRRRGPALLLALALLPSLQLVPIMRWWSPHYFYVPLTFAAMLAAEALDRLPRRVPIVASAALAAVFAALSLIDARRFHDDESLWRPEVAAQPACREGQFYLAEVDRQARRFAAAAKKYEAALAPRPGMLAFVDRTAALENMGTTYIALRRFTDAKAAFRNALAGTGDPRRRRELTHDLAGASLEAGDAAEAERLLAPETARPDAFPESLALRARALHDLGRNEEAQSLMARLPHAK